MSDLEQELGNYLRAQLAPLLGEQLEIEALSRLTGGAAAQTWAFIARTGDLCQELILRLGQDGQQFGAALPKTREAELIRAARRAGVLAPEVLLGLPSGSDFGEGFIMRRVNGEALPQRILRDPKYSPVLGKLTNQCATSLAAIHGIALDGRVSLPRLDARTQIDLYRESYRAYPLQSPVLDYAFRWLEQRARPSGAEAVVHGDFRNGNLLIDEQGITAVLDWELAHIGDPMEDLGWLCVNSWRFGHRDKPVGGFGQRAELYAAYEAAGGAAVDAEAVHYWEVFGTLKWAVICLYQAHVHMSGRESSLERAAIGRRVSECEIDLIALLKGQQP